MIKIDLEKSVVTLDTDGRTVTHKLETPEAFAIISEAWLRCGWDTKYVYTFSWMGRPVIQLPEDLMRIQETIYALKPDVLIETGVAHGGSLVFYASLFKAMGRGRVIGVDVEIRPHNRKAIEAHEFAPLIMLVEGSSIAPEIVSRVKSLVKPGEKVLVLLDSNHTKEHVLAELNAYAPLVTPGSYIIATDGIMEQVTGAPRTKPDWAWNNPKHAAREFLAKHPEFVLERPAFAFNESPLKDWITYWPDGWLKRVSV